MARKKISADVIRNAAEILKALSHPERLHLIECLARRQELTVAELMSEIGTDQATTSKHLSFLRMKGILKSRSEANYRYYSIAAPHVIGILDCIQNHHV